MRIKEAGAGECCAGLRRINGHGGRFLSATEGCCWLMFRDCSSDKVRAVGIAEVHVQQAQCLTDAGFSVSPILLIPQASASNNYEITPLLLSPPQPNAMRGDKSLMFPTPDIHSRSRTKARKFRPFRR